MEHSTAVTGSGDGSRRVGIAIVGLGGAVATTAAAGVELLRLGATAVDGLPLAEATVVGADGTSRSVADVAGLVDYTALYFAGWDLAADDLAKASEVHRVLDASQHDAVASALSSVTPWPGIGNPEFCRGIGGDHRLGAPTHRDAVAAITADMERFRVESSLDGLVVVNLASTERRLDLGLDVLASVDAFEAGLDADDPNIGPAQLYAYAAIRGGVPYANFTPSVAADVPALVALAEQLEVPIAGKDGKTGQTMLKTVIAPGLRSRALRVEGWYSANILGNRDGEALDDPDSLASKIDTKGSVLDSVLGYHVEDHVVTINYYRPRGDAKEAWDNIDLIGFLGQRMQLKVNFLCKDSILAAPLVLEIARVLDCAVRRGDGGVQEQLSLFFKAPMTPAGGTPEHALLRQEQHLMDWLLAPVEQSLTSG